MRKLGILARRKKRHERLFLTLRSIHPLNRLDSRRQAALKGHPLNIGGPLEEDQQNDRKNWQHLTKLSQL